MRKRARKGKKTKKDARPVCVNLAGSHRVRIVFLLNKKDAAIEPTVGTYAASLDVWN